MTIEELLSLDVAKLELMTKEDLEHTLMPYFCHTRPTGEPKQNTAQIFHNKRPSFSNRTDRANELIKMFELKLGNIK